jgi:cytochrome c biogenesis factor
LVDVVVSQTVEIEGELSEAEGFIRAMDVEFKSLSAAEKRNAQQKVNDFRAGWKREDKIVERESEARFVNGDTGTIEANFIPD